ncbi:hypothetical protein LR48_Vigan05g090600 [Vigna angularis]|uniref:Uncharacterized protein n=1 Tax=Phaseolus angularis TaxID=3914 RepID=A0A0L9UL51_PHAAN|nr:hypothetical protein LR48_Vigan05g090600 [Vigna angularis]
MINVCLDQGRTFKGLTWVPLFSLLNVHPRGMNVHNIINVRLDQERTFKGLTWVPLFSLLNVRPRGTDVHNIINVRLDQGRTFKGLTWVPLFSLLNVRPRGTDVHNILNVCLDQGRTSRVPLIYEYATGQLYTLGLLWTDVYWGTLKANSALVFGWRLLLLTSPRMIIAMTRRTYNDETTQGKNAGPSGLYESVYLQAFVHPGDVVTGNTQQLPPEDEQLKENELTRFRTLNRSVQVEARDDGNTSTVSEQ